MLMTTKINIEFYKLSKDGKEIKRGTWDVVKDVFEELIDDSQTDIEKSANDLWLNGTYKNYLLQELPWSYDLINDMIYKDKDLKNTGFLLGLTKSEAKNFINDSSKEVGDQFIMDENSFEQECTRQLKDLEGNDHEYIKQLALMHYLQNVHPESVIYINGEYIEIIGPKIYPS